MNALALLVFAACSAICARAAVPSEDALLKIATDANAGVVERTRAFADLQAVATDQSLSALASLLADPAWSYSARWVLESMPGVAVDRALLEALKTTRDDALRAGLANSLGQRRTADAAPEIAALLGSANVPLVAAALDALGYIATERAAEALVKFAPSAESSTAWADASLRAAEVFRKTHSEKALALYRAVKAKGPPPQAAAAVIGLACMSAQPATAIVAALRAEEEQSRTAALAVIRSGEFGPALTTAAGEALPSLPAPVQVQVLSVLYDRGDRAAAPIARRALGAHDRDVSAAAAKLLSVVGEPSDAPALLRLMIGADEPAPSARLALTRIPGPETAALLVDAFRRGGEARTAALEVLVGRGHRALLPELLNPEFFADESFRPLAANAILALGTGADLGRVLEFYCRLPLEQRPALEAAVRRIAAKDPSADAAARVTFAAAEKLPLAEAAPLYTVVAGVGGEVALASLSTMAKSGPLERRTTALRALGSWRDAAPAPMLLDLAASDAEPGVRALAVRSATTVLTRSAFAGNNAPVPALVPSAIEGLRKTWAVAGQPAEKAAVVSALRSLKLPPAVAAAEELEKKPQGAP